MFSNIIDEDEKSKIIENRNFDYLAQELDVIDQKFENQIFDYFGRGWDLIDKKGRRGINMQGREGIKERVKSILNLDIENGKNALTEAQTHHCRK